MVKTETRPIERVVTRGLTEGGSRYQSNSVTNPTHQVMMMKGDSNEGDHQSINIETPCPGRCKPPWTGRMMRLCGVAPDCLTPYLDMSTSLRFSLDGLHTRSKRKEYDLAVLLDIVYESIGRRRTFPSRLFNPLLVCLNPTSGEYIPIHTVLNLLKRLNVQYACSYHQLIMESPSQETRC